MAAGKLIYSHNWLIRLGYEAGVINFMSESYVCKKVIHGREYSGWWKLYLQPKQAYNFRK
jgi:hypothetical protein